MSVKIHIEVSGEDMSLPIDDLTAAVTAVSASATALINAVKNNAGSAIEAQVAALNTVKTALDAETADLTKTQSQTPPPPGP